MSEDRDLLFAIQKMLNGQEWSSDTLQEVAEMLRGGGYHVRDLGDDLHNMQHFGADGSRVSTVCIGEVFETRVFGGLHDGKSKQYPTLDDAQAGHREFIELVGL